MVSAIYKGRHGPRAKHDIWRSLISLLDDLKSKIHKFTYLIQAGPHTSMCACDKYINVRCENLSQNLLIRLSQQTQIQNDFHHGLTISNLHLNENSGGSRYKESSA